MRRILSRLPQGSKPKLYQDLLPLYRRVVAGDATALAELLRLAKQDPLPLELYPLP